MESDKTNHYSTDEFKEVIRHLSDAANKSFQKNIVDTNNWNDLSEYHYICESQRQFSKNSKTRIKLSRHARNWIDHMAGVLTNLVPATPNHKKWYEECYSYASLPSPSEGDNGNFCCDQIGEKGAEAKNCNNCLSSDYEDTITVNYHSQCLDKLIDIFYTCADNLVTMNTNDSRESRFILTGYAGEGKSAWLNNFFSIKQDEMWGKKLINIKVEVTDTILKDKFKLVAEKGGPELPLFFERIIGTKIVRIFQQHYRSLTTQIISNDHRPKLNNHALISCFSVDDMEGEYPLLDNKDIDTKPINVCDGCYVLKYNLNGPMSDKDRDTLLDLFPNDEEWIDDINRLYFKSQSTLTETNMAEIEEGINELVDRKIITSEQKNSSWDTQLQRKHRDECNPTISRYLANKLIKFGYRFLIVFDGVDGHHNMEKSEDSNEEFLDALLGDIFTPKSNPWKASLLVVVREETVNRKIFSFVHPGGTWGPIRRLELEGTDLKDILDRRMKYISGMKKYTGPFYPYLYAHIPDFITTLFSKYVDVEEEIPELRITDYDKGFQVLLFLLRDNRRKALGFIELFIKSIFWKLDRMGRLGSHDPSVPPEFRLSEFVDVLANKSYLFWDPLIYRTKTYYHDSYYHLYDGNSLDKRLKKDFISSKIVYGTIPNIFNFIIPKVTTEAGDSRHPLKNKLTIRVRILLALENKSWRLNTVCKNIALLFDLKYEEEVKWEIQELVSVGLITTKWGSDNGPCSFDENSLDGNPKIQPTHFWKVLKKYWRNKYILRGFLPDTYIPEFIQYEEFMTFPAIPTRIADGHDGLQRRRRLIASIASEFVVITLVINYLSFLESELYLRYKAIKKTINKGFFHDSNFFFIRNSAEEILNNLCKSKGFLSNKPPVIEGVYNEIKRVADHYDD